MNKCIIAQDVMIYFGDMNLSGLIVVTGMILLCFILVCYWGFNFIKYLRQRAEQRAKEEDDRGRYEVRPLLDNVTSGNSSWSNNKVIIM